MRGSISLLTVLGLTILGLTTGCDSGDSKRSSRHSYDFKVSGCPVSHIKGRYNNFEDMCRALLLETQVNPCGANEIYRTFEAKNCHRNDLFLQQNPLQTNGQMLNPGGFIDHSGQDILATPHGNIVLEGTPDHIELDQELAYEDQIISSRIENYYVDLKNKKAIIDGHLEIDLSVLDDDGRGIYVNEDEPQTRPRTRVVIEEPRRDTPAKAVEETRPTPRTTKVEETVTEDSTFVPTPEERPKKTVTEPEARQEEAPPVETTKEELTPSEEETKPTQTIAPTNFNLVSFKKNGILYSEVPSPSSQSRLPILKITSTLDSRSPLYNKKHLDATTALATEIVEPSSNGCEVLSYISTSKEVLVLSLQVKDKNNETQIAACKTWFQSITTTGFKILTPKLNTDKGNQISGEFEFVNRD